MLDPVPHRPWTLFAGGLTAAVGAALLVASRLSSELPLLWSGSAIGLAAIIELATGASFSRRGGAAMDHLFAGGMTVALAGFLLSTWLFNSDALTAAPLALLFGVFCAANAIFRTFDLFFDRPRALLTEAIDVAVTLVLSAVLLTEWRQATGSFFGVVAGLELLVGGLSITGAGVAMWRHPELSPYDDPQERLARLTRP